MGGRVTWMKEGGHGSERGDGGGWIHHQSKSGIITERFITRGHRSVMPIHVCKPFLNIPRTYICVSRVNPRNIQPRWFFLLLSFSVFFLFVFSSGDLGRTAGAHFEKPISNNARAANFCAGVESFTQNANPSPSSPLEFLVTLFISAAWLIDHLINYDSLLRMRGSVIAAEPRPHACKLPFEISFVIPQRSSKESSWKWTIVIESFSLTVSFVRVDSTTDFSYKMYHAYIIYVSWCNVCFWYIW